MAHLVKDIMARDFDYIDEDASVDQAIERILHGKTRKSGYRTISLMVVNARRQLVGVVTLFDILYHLRPTFLNLGIDGSEVPWEGMLEPAVREVRGKKVRNIMSKGVVTASPDEHCMVIIDRMVKNRYRRLPVIDNGKIVGVVYVADVFQHLFNKV